MYKASIQTRTYVVWAIIIKDNENNYIRKTKIRNGLIKQLRSAKHKEKLRLLCLLFGHYRNASMICVDKNSGLTVEKF